MVLTRLLESPPRISDGFENGTLSHQVKPETPSCQGRVEIIDLETPICIKYSKASEIEYRLETELVVPNLVPNLVPELMAQAQIKASPFDEPLPPPDPQIDELARLFTRLSL